MAGSQQWSKAAVDRKAADELASQFVAEADYLQGGSLCASSEIVRDR
jgi:hypothetical protein